MNIRNCLKLIDETTDSSIDLSVQYFSTALGDDLQNTRFELGVLVRILQEGNLQLEALVRALQRPKYHHEDRI